MNEGRRKKARSHCESNKLIEWNNYGTLCGSWGEYHYIMTPDGVFCRQPWGHYCKILHHEPRRLLLPLGQMASSATNLGATTAKYWVASSNLQPWVKSWKHIIFIVLYTSYNIYIIYIYIYIYILIDELSVSWGPGTNWTPVANYPTPAQDLPWESN